MPEKLHSYNICAAWAEDLTGKVSHPETSDIYLRGLSKTCTACQGRWAGIFLQFGWGIMTLTIKLILTVACVGLWLLTQKLLGQRKVLFKDRISDFILQWTEPQNAYLHKAPRVANALLISSSLVIDALGIFIIAQTLWGESVRPLLALLVLFTLRQINQAITMLPTPPGMIWRDPGVPSLFVTYGVSNDLFFSGHTALAVLGALELAQLGGPLFMTLAVAVVIFEVLVVLLLRAHWTMDVFAGAVTAAWVYDLVGRFAPSLDAWIAQF